VRLSSKLIHNTLFNLVGRVWPLLLGLITTPYVINELGLEPYGVLSLVGTVLGYLVLLDLGLNTSLIKYLAQYYAVRDFETIKDYLGTSFVVYTIIGLIGCLIIIGLTNFLVGSLLKISPDLQPLARFAFHVAAISFFIGLISSIFQAVLVGFQRYDLSNSIDLLINTARSIGTVLILWQGLWFREIILFHLVVSLIGLGITFLLSSQLLPGFRLAFVPNIARTLMGFGAMTLISRISGLLLFQFNRLYIGFALGAVIVTYYAVADTLGRQMHGFSQSMTLAVFPLTSELKMTDRLQTLRYLYLRGMKWSIIIATAMTAVVGALSFKLLYYWLGPDFAQVSTSLLQLLLITYCAAAFTTVSYFIVDGVGLPHYNAFFALMTAIINVVGCIILVPKLGLLGAGVANVLVIGVIPIYLYIVERKVLDIRDFSHLFDVYFRPCFVALLTFIFVYLIQAYWVNSLVELIITAGAGLVIFVLLTIIFRVFQRDDIEPLLQYLNTVLSQGKLILRHFISL
jgi:O-antigen/teichoic acid export membrane protein